MRKHWAPLSLPEICGIAVAATCLTVGVGGLIKAAIDSKADKSPEIVEATVQRLNGTRDRVGVYRITRHATGRSYLVATYGPGGIANLDEENPPPVAGTNQDQP